MIYFIPDANVFLQDPRMTSEDWRLVREFIRRGEGRLIVPELVLQETVNKFRERLAEYQAEVQESASKLTNLIGSTCNVADLKIESEARHYDAYLRSKLTGMGTLILPFPKISHQELVNRDLAQIKPFAPKGGKGYRDALIWLSILQKAPKDKTVKVLITNNSSDFALSKDKKDVLHPALEKEWQRSSAVGDVRLRSTLRSFVDEFVKPSLERLDALRDKLNQGKILDIKEYLAEHFDEAFDGINERLRLRTHEVDLEEPFGVSGLGEPKEVEVEDVLALQGSKVYVEFTALYEDNLVFAYVFHSEAFGLREESTFQVSDPDWNESYSEVEATLDLKVTCGMTINRKSRRVIGFEVKEARNVEEF